MDDKKYLVYPRKSGILAFVGYGWQSVENFLNNERLNKIQYNGDFEPDDWEIICIPT